MSGKRNAQGVFGDFYGTLGTPESPLLDPNLHISFREYVGPILTNSYISSHILTVLERYERPFRFSPQFFDHHCPTMRWAGVDADCIMRLYSTCMWNLVTKAPDDALPGELVSLYNSLMWIWCSLRVKNHGTSVQICFGFFGALLQILPIRQLATQGLRSKKYSFKQQKPFSHPVKHMLSRFGLIGCEANVQIVVDFLVLQINAYLLPISATDKLLIYQVSCAKAQYIGRSAHVRMTRTYVSGVSCRFRDHATSFHKHRFGATTKAQVRSRYLFNEEARLW